MSTDIFEWTPEAQIPRHGILAFVGTTGSGKSTLMMDQLSYYADKLDFVMAFVGSQDVAEKLSQHVPSLWIHTSWKPHKLEELYRDQEIDRATLGKHRMKYVGIFIDDFAYLKTELFNSKIIVKIAYNCRHANLIVFLSTQYCKDITVPIRDNTKVGFFLANKNPKMREKIFDAYNPGFANFLDYDNTFKKLTKRKGDAMVGLFAGNNSYALSKSVFYYRANPNPEYRVNPTGKWWTTNKIKYDPNYITKNLSEQQRKLVRAKQAQARKDQRQQVFRPIPGSLIIRKRPRAISSQFYSF